MWEKVKNFFSLIGVFLSGLFVALLFRRGSDGRGTKGDYELAKYSGRNNTDTRRPVEEIENRLSEVGNGLHDAAGQLRRASEILRKAQGRSEEVQD